MQYAFGVMQQTIHGLAEAKLIHAPGPDLVAQIVLGAVIEAAHGVAISTSKRRALANAQSTIKHLVRALRISSYGD